MRRHGAPQRDAFTAKDLRKHHGIAHVMGWPPPVFMTRHPGPGRARPKLIGFLMLRGPSNQSFPNQRHRYLESNFSLRDKFAITIDLGPHCP